MLCRINSNNQILVFLCKKYVNLLAFFCMAMTIVQAKNLQIEIAPIFDERPLAAHSSGALDSGFSITRLDYLLSGLQFQTKDDEWIELRNWFGYFSFEEARNTVAIDAPPGEYKALRFNVGVKPDINASDPNQYPPSHPLNPQVNGLHWGWQGGYVFLAIEGHYKKRDGSLGGFSYHIANDENLALVELPFEFDSERHARIDLALDASLLLDGKHRIDILETPSSHSRPGDSVVPDLLENLRTSFRVSNLSSDTYHSQSSLSSYPDANIVSGSTPYRLHVTERFPKVEFPADNPLTEEAVDLGEILFNDKRLSKGEAQSCASCHQADAAFSDTLALSVGVEGKPGKRNSMPLFNLAWSPSFFWDGRATTLREQALMPIQDHLEMNESLDRVVEKLGQDEHYPSLFKAAFGSPEITPDRVGLALEQFLITRISQDSKFDLAIRNETTLTDLEKRGLELFVTEYDPSKGLYGADCFHCHGGNLFTNNRFANNGLDYTFADVGRQAVTENPADVGKFKVPSLRNVALTGPYMHDGRFATLEEVIEHYNSGVKPSSTLDPNLAKHLPTGIHLSDSDKKALVAFLKTLTDVSLQPKTSLASTFSN